MLSFENNHNSGIVFSKKGSDRQSFRVNVDHSLSDKIKISSSTNITETVLDYPGEGAASAFYDLLFMNPDVNLDMEAPLSDTTFLKEYFYKPDNWSISGNPKHALYHQKQKTKRSSVLQNLTANATIFNWLIADVDYSLEKRNSDLSWLMPVGYMSSTEQQRNGFFAKQSTNGLNQTFSSTLNLNQKFGDFVTKGKMSYMFEKSEESISWGAGDSLLASGVQTLSAVTERIRVSSGNYTTIAKKLFWNSRYGL